MASIETISSVIVPNAPGIVKVIADDDTGISLYCDTVIPNDDFTTSPVLEWTDEGSGVYKTDLTFDADQTQKVIQFFFVAKNQCSGVGFNLSLASDMSSPTALTILRGYGDLADIDCEMGEVSAGLSGQFNIDVTALLSDTEIIMVESVDLAENVVLELPVQDLSLVKDVSKSISVNWEVNTSFDADNLFMRLVYTPEITGQEESVILKVNAEYNPYLGLGYTVLSIKREGFGVVSNGANVQVNGSNVRLGQTWAGSGSVLFRFASNSDQNFIVTGMDVTGTDWDNTTVFGDPIDIEAYGTANYTFSFDSIIATGLGTGTLRFYIEDEAENETYVDINILWGNS